jgi:hypothetical protein
MDPEGLPKRYGAILGVWDLIGRRPPLPRGQTRHTHVALSLGLQIVILRGQLNVGVLQIACGLPPALQVEAIGLIRELAEGAIPVTSHQSGGEP